MQLLTILSFVLLTSCILRPPPPADKKFITTDHVIPDFQLNRLIDKVHAPHLNIAYTYGDNCLPEEKNNDEALTAAIGKALRTWLQPLRDYSDKPIVADFRSQRVAFLRPHDEDLGITFHCEEGISSAVGGLRPAIDMRRGMKVDKRFMSTLIHEMGHSFGLADTYDMEWKLGKLGRSAGGLAGTKGTQPASVMSGHIRPAGWWGGGGAALDGIASLGKDDIDGIVWLYKHRHEGLPLENCFFPAYELEETPLGCRPKYPLIFEIKQGQEHWAGEVLKDDPNLDINAQDKDGLTALHHAVLNRFEELVTKLIAHQDIKPFLKNADGHSALDLAHQLKLARIAALIAAHPKAMPVAAKGKQTTTWGELKKEE